MNVSFHIRKAIIELEMAKYEADSASKREEIQTIIDGVLKLKWVTQGRK
jgi:hypothetical protein